MDAAGIAQLLTAGIAPPVGSADMGYHTGVIKSWDESSGVNVVTVQGVDFSNLNTIQGGIGIFYQPGDVVGVMRFQTRYFVLGKVAAPGAGASSQMAYAEDNTVLSPASLAVYPTFDVIGASPGPAVTTYIGSNRRAFVIVSMLIRVQGAASYQGVRVSGASNIAPSLGKCASLASNSISAVGTGAFIQSACTKAFALTAADGLNQGFNTFTTNYSSDTTYGLGGRNDVTSRNILIIPF
jgi:hypothetical protein